METVSFLGAPAEVTKAIKKASQATGTAFDYLLRTAARESSFEHDAEARNSSATGLFQFIEDTWLQAVKVDGPGLGLEKYSDLIQQNSRGRYLVKDATDRRRILNLRKDPEISSMIAGAYTRRNADYMRGKTNRDPSHAELYMAHFLGPKNASRLVRLNEVAPQSNADRFFPDAASANRRIFYHRGKPRSVHQVYRILSREHDAAERIAKTVNAATGKDVTLGPWRVEITREGQLGSSREVAGNLTGGTTRKAEAGEIGLWKTIVSRDTSGQNGQGPGFMTARGNVNIQDLFQDAGAGEKNGSKNEAEQSGSPVRRRTFKSTNILGGLDLGNSLFNNFWSSDNKKG